MDRFILNAHIGQTKNLLFKVISNENLKEQISIDNDNLSKKGLLIKFARTQSTDNGEKDLPTFVDIYALYDSTESYLCEAIVACHIRS